MLQSQIALEITPKVENSSASGAGENEIRKAGKMTKSGRTLETGINPWVLGFAFCNQSGSQSGSEGATTESLEA
jgi:hypothetical protein